MQVGQKVEEAEVWHDLAHVYSQLKQWEDAETCLEKARLLDSYSAATWHKTGERIWSFVVASLTFTKSQPFLNQSIESVLKHQFRQSP